MPFIYHLAPGNMRGSTLYPLNVLKVDHPDLYQDHAKKYEGRGHVMEIKIPRLNCLWNDVLHFSAVHPGQIVKALADLGKQRKYTYYEIDARELDPANTVVYLYKKRERGVPPPEDEFIPFVPDEIDAHALLPPETVQYYKESLASGRSPLLYHLVPHILYKGSIDVSDAKIISV